MFIFFNYTATTDIYTYLHTLSLHDALPIYDAYAVVVLFFVVPGCLQRTSRDNCQKSGSQCTVPGTHFFCYHRRSEEHTSELQSLMRISYAVFCLKQNKKKHKTT